MQIPFDIYRMLQLSCQASCLCRADTGMPVSRRHRRKKSSHDISNAAQLLQHYIRTQRILIYILYISKKELHHPPGLVAWAPMNGCGQHGCNWSIPTPSNSLVENDGLSSGNYFFDIPSKAFDLIFIACIPMIVFRFPTLILNSAKHCLKRWQVNHSQESKTQPLPLSIRLQCPTPF